MDRYTMYLDELLRNDPTWTRLPRFLGGTEMLKHYTKPGWLLGAFRGAPPAPTYSAHGTLRFVTVGLVVDDWMDIELLWKPWCLAIRPEGLVGVGKRDEGGYVLMLHVYPPFVEPAVQLWDRLRAELDENRSRR